MKLEATESDGRLKLLVDGPFRCNCDSWDRRRNGYHVNYDFKLRIPADAAFDVRTVNGKLTMERIAGAGKATTVNGEVLVVYAKNPPGPAAFETINGNVDVSFPPGLSADLRMKTMNGGMYTDFDVRLCLFRRPRWNGGTGNLFTGPKARRECVSRAADRRSISRHSTAIFT